MRDLFQVVFALKKKEIELAKQHLERSSPLFSDGSSTYSKVCSYIHIAEVVSLIMLDDFKLDYAYNIFCIYLYFH